MRVALLGGSFDPPHLGHLLVADELISTGFDRVILIPSNISAHANKDVATSGSLRLAMCRRVAEVYGFEASGCEIDRGGVSYTIDTIAHIRKQYAVTGFLGLVIGDDLLEGFHTWRNYRGILDQTELIVARRGDEKTERQDISYSRLDNPDFPVSSTEIRKRIGAGRPVRFLLPPEVHRFIQDNRLYTALPEKGT